MKTVVQQIAAWGIGLSVSSIAFAQFAPWASDIQRENLNKPSTSTYEPSVAEISKSNDGRFGKNNEAGVGSTFKSGKVGLPREHRDRYDKLDLQQVVRIGETDNIVHFESNQAFRVFEQSRYKGRSHDPGQKLVDAIQLWEEFAAEKALENPAYKDLRFLESHLSPYACKNAAHTSERKDHADGFTYSEDWSYEYLYRLNKADQCVLDIQSNQQFVILERLKNGEYQVSTQSKFSLDTMWEHSKMAVGNAIGSQEPQAVRERVRARRNRK